ncbi:MAG: hypothetical protein II240_04920, partial [Bacteroidaceae bacterium]|nr:hypothetical protein [Bacteroidaceae bacterium]
MNTNITKIVNVRKDVIYKSNTKKLTYAIAMIAAGIVACILSAHVDKSNEVLNMSLIVIGASVFFVGLFLALSRPKMFIYLPTGSIYQVLSADVGNKHGFNTHGVVFDELHTQPN